MKKIFTLLTAALVTLTSFAERPDGSITIMDNSRKQLWIEVDGYQYADNQQTIYINNLRPGAHTVKVMAVQRYRDWRGVFERHGRRQVIYNGVVYVKPRQHTFIIIDRFGQVSIEERRGNRRNDRDDDWERGRDRDRDRDNDYNRRPDDRFDPSRSAMDAQSFEMLKKALARENFEKSRMEIARQTIDRNNFSAMQVRQLALLFAFEDSKLDLTKYAYHKTVDKNNYYLVYDVFSFSSSKQELAEYTRRY